MSGVVTRTHGEYERRPLWSFPVKAKRVWECILDEVVAA